MFIQHGVSGKKEIRQKKVICWWNGRTKRFETNMRRSFVTFEYERKERRDPKPDSNPGLKQGKLKRFT